MTMSALKRKARWSTGAAMLAMIVVPTACDNALEVEPASRIPASLIETPANAQLLSVGAIGDFECAFNVYTMQAGIVGEEFMYTGQTLSRQPYDRRAMTKDDPDYAINSCTGAGVYTPLQTARQSNENLLALLKTWSDEDVAAGPGNPNRTRLIARAAAYAGYSYVLLSEGFCTMAISSVNIDKSITYGGEIQPDSVAKLGIARFSEAITAATSLVGPTGTAEDTSVLKMAYLGRARAKLKIADYTGAKADAQQVTGPFERQVSASDAAPRRQNRITSENSATARGASVGEPYRSMTDSRVPLTNSGLLSPHTPPVTHWFQRKYATTGTPLPLATYEEAQLIIAEAEIRAGALSAAQPIIAASRTRGGQGAFGGTTAGEYLAELIDQRRRELFAESHHLGDLIRFQITPQPAATSTSHFGGPYGSQLCFPLPAAERLNNPLIGG
jgi:hypothetical protein